MERNSNYLQYAETNQSSSEDQFKRTPRIVRFQDEERRNNIPFRINRDDMSMNRSYDRENLRDDTPPRERNYTSERGNYPSRSRSPNGYYPSNYYPYMPMMPYQYPPFPPPNIYNPFMPYQQPYYQNPNRQNYPFSRSTSPNASANRAQNLNYQEARRTDAATSTLTQESRPTQVKFLTIEDSFATHVQEEDQ